MYVASEDDLMVHSDIKVENNGQPKLVFGQPVWEIFCLKKHVASFKKSTYKQVI